MSLSHRHPATLNRRVHYISPFFHPVEAQLAGMERETAKAPRAPVEPVKPRSAVQLLAHQRRRDKAPPPPVIRHLCSSLNLRLQCGEILLMLWRANGAIVSLEDFGYPTKSISTALSQIRRALPRGVTIRSSPKQGWFIPASERGALTALIERGAP